MTTKATTQNGNQSSAMSGQMRRFLALSSVTLFAFIILTAYLLPFAYMGLTAFKTKEQISEPTAPLWPASEITYTYEGEDYPVFKVPTDQGIQNWALVKKGREVSSFVDPNNSDVGLIEWEGRWRTLDRSWQWSPEWSNFQIAWEIEGKPYDMPRLLFNSFSIAILGGIGTLISSVLVGYGFARFRFPGDNILFLVLIATIILPRTVLIVPTYAFFVSIGWVGTWLPLIIPHFFANAYNVFLLRQYFLTIPREIDEAAMIDGAGPLRTLVSIILPQSIPVLIAVGLFHFVFAWNDYFEPLIYLSTVPELQPISVGIQTFNFLYDQRVEILQAASLLGLAVPIIIFFFAQNYFIKGVVVSGTEK